MGGAVSSFGRTAPPLAALPLLATAALLPVRIGWVVAVVAIVVLGVPHGALDVEIGRSLLRRRFPLLWFPLFAGPYLLLVGAVLLCWRWAPLATLGGFLAASAWHFGREDTGGGGWPALALGGLPIAVPVLAQPAATAHILSVTAGVPFEAVPPWLLAASVAWLLPLAVFLLRAETAGLARTAGLVAAFALLPPVVAFAGYFVCLHAPAHVAALVRHGRRAPRVRDAAAAWRLALPTTLLTVAIGAALWPFFSGPVPERLLCLTLQLLAAFTLPHLLLDAWLDQADRVVAPAARSWPFWTDQRSSTP